VHFSVCLLYAFPFHSQTFLVVSSPALLSRLNISHFSHDLVVVSLLGTIIWIENPLLQSSCTSAIVGCGFEWRDIPICNNKGSSSGRPPLPCSTHQFCWWIGMGAPHPMGLMSACVQSSLDWRAETWPETCWIQSSYVSEQWERYVRLEAVTAALLRVQVCWNVMLCLWVSGSWQFEGLWCLQNMGSRLPSNTMASPRRLESSVRNAYHVIYSKTLLRCFWKFQENLTS
jgi:hypothetical protein